MGNGWCTRLKHLVEWYHLMCYSCWCQKWLANCKVAVASTTSVCTTRFSGQLGASILPVLEPSVVQSSTTSGCTLMGDAHAGEWGNVKWARKQIKNETDLPLKGENACMLNDNPRHEGSRINKWIKSPTWESILFHHLLLGDNLHCLKR